MERISTEYKINKNTFAVSDVGPTLFDFFRDDPRRKSWEDFDERSQEKYFKDGYELFLVRLHEFKRLDRRATVNEEKELRFMLDALLAAKEFLSDK